MFQAYHMLSNFNNNYPQVLCRKNCRFRPQTHHLGNHFGDNFSFLHYPKLTSKMSITRSSN